MQTGTTHSEDPMYRAKCTRCDWTIDATDPAFRDAADQHMLDCPGRVTAVRLRTITVVVDGNDRPVLSLVDGKLAGANEADARLFIQVADGGVDEDTLKVRYQR